MGWEVEYTDEEYVPRADAIYAQYLQELDKNSNSPTRNDP